MRVHKRSLPRWPNYGCEAHGQNRHTEESTTSHDPRPSQEGLSESERGGGGCPTVCFGLSPTPSVGGSHDTGVRGHTVGVQVEALDTHTHTRVHSLSKACGWGAETLDSFCSLTPEGEGAWRGVDQKGDKKDGGRRARSKTLEPLF